MSDEAKQSAGPAPSAEQEGSQPGTSAPAGAGSDESAPRRPPIKIGSQRQSSGVIRARPQPLLAARTQAATTERETPAGESLIPGSTPVVDEKPASARVAPTAAAAAPVPSPGTAAQAAAPPTEAPAPAATPAAPPVSFPPPRLRDIISDEVQQEIDAAMGDFALEEMMTSRPRYAGPELEPESVHRGRVLSVRGRDVFVDLGGRNQGLVPLGQFQTPPEPGSMVEIAVKRFDSAEGLYELTIPNAAASVAGWAELAEGMVLDAVVTGHNQGGLEVEVKRLRGFVPISQVALFRVESLAEYVGQRLTCVVLEVDAEGHNLVLSRRAMLERQRAEDREALLASIEVGQNREGVVTRLQPFGAFVDLGGIDGLIHVSQLSWDRVAHPSEVLEVGQRVKVRVAKFDRQTGKIGLAYRESWDNPWDTAERRYPTRMKAEGTISKLTDFGAFVRLEPGIEGLIHISELDHRRVFRASDVVKEGQKVDVLVLSVDPEQQRISLSLKALQARPLPPGKKTEDEESDAPVPSPPVPNRGPDAPLKGGVDRPSGGARFGLKW